MTRKEWLAALSSALHARTITRATEAVGRVLAEMTNGARQCWPSYEHLAYRAACDVRTVGRAVASLARVGMLAWKRRPGRAGRLSSNLYTLVNRQKEREDNLLKGYADKLSEGRTPSEQQVVARIAAMLGLPPDDVLPPLSPMLAGALGRLGATISGSDGPSGGLSRRD
jgi:alkylated DNA nucleotide flippase Atl1